MPEQWACGHCPLIIDIPDEQTCRPAYIDTILRIREHRFGHLTDALIAETPEEMFGLCVDTPSGYDLHRRPVTSDDVAAALVEADRIVRRGA